MKTKTKKVILIIILLFLSISSSVKAGAIEIEKDVFPKDNLMPFTSIKYNNNLIGVGGVYSYVDRATKPNEGFFYKDNNDRYITFNTSIKLDQLQAINKKQLKLLKSYPIKSPKILWKTGNVIGIANEYLFRYKDKVAFLPRENYKLDATSSYYEDIKYLMNNHQKVINIIEDLPYDKNKTNEENKLIIWNHLKNTIKYDYSYDGYYLEDFFEAKRKKPKMICQSIANLYGLIVNYLELDRMTRIRGIGYSDGTSERHSILQDKEGYYYDLTFNIDKNINGYYKINKALLNSYFTKTKDGNQKLRKELKNNIAKDTIKENPYGYYRFRYRRWGNIKDNLNKKDFINIVLNNFSLSKAESIFTKLNIDYGQIELNRDNINVLVESNPVKLYNDYILKDKKNAIEIFDIILNDLSHQEIFDFLLKTVGEDKIKRYKSRNKQELLNKLYNAGFSSINFKFSELDIVKKSRQQNDNLKKTNRIKPHQIRFEKYLINSNIDRDIIKKILLKEKKKNKNNKRVIDILNDLLEVL